MNSYCLICHEGISAKISWNALFSREKEVLICESCKSKLEEITGEQCDICCRPLHDAFRMCNDCTRWEENPEWKGALDKNISLFQYNNFLKEVIARFKFRGDYILSRLFAENVKKRISELDIDLITPIPLSTERQYERGFNQAEAIILNAGFDPVNLLTRIHSEKQSKKSRKERIRIPQVFQISAEINLEGKKVVLVDDIYTTGSTLRHAAKVLKQAGSEKVFSFTVAR
ncbi:MAG: ComF family protein [Bacillota bacterium]|nr:ComF family protein [Bacillota bacterium]